MIKLQYPFEKVDKIFKSTNFSYRYRMDKWTSYMNNIHLQRMLSNEEFPFEEGSIITTKNGVEYPLFQFKRGFYKYYINDEIIESNVWFITSHTQGKIRTFVLGIVPTTYEDGRYIDLFVETLNDDDYKELHQIMDDPNLMILFSLKIAIPLMDCQLAGLKSKKIIKRYSSEQRHFNNCDSTYKYNNKVYLSNGITFTNEYDDKRPYARHMESWEVKGHYRHYKNGKVVFIKGYTKGEGTKQDKIYVVPLD